MKILNNIVIGGTLLCLPILGFAASPPLVSFEEGTTNPAMPALIVGDSIEVPGAVHANMTITSETPDINDLHPGAYIPATIIESYAPTSFDILGGDFTDVAYVGPNPLPFTDPPFPPERYQPNACLEDVNGDRVYWADSVYNALGGGDKVARGFAMVQPYYSLSDPDNFTHWKFDVNFEEPVKNFTLTMFDYGDFNPFFANEYHAKMTAFDEDGVELASQQINFRNDGTSGVISELLAEIGDACGADDYEGRVFWDPDLSDPLNPVPPYDPAINMHPGYIAGTLQAIGIKKIVVESSLDENTEFTGDPKVGFDSIDFGESCTYTRGYWSNHPWSLPEITLGNYIYPEESSDDIFGKANSRNYGQLCAQLAAATLNCEGYNCAPDGIIQSANELLVEEDVACNAPQGFDSKAEKTVATDLKTLLDMFNQSYPCDDEEEMQYEEE